MIKQILYCSGSQPVTRGPPVVRSYVPGGPRASRNKYEKEKCLKFVKFLSFRSRHFLWGLFVLLTKKGRSEILVNLKFFLVVRAKCGIILRSGVHESEKVENRCCRPIV